MVRDKSDERESRMKGKEKRVMKKNGIQIVFG